MHWFCWHDWSKWKTYQWRGTVSIFGRAPQETLYTNQVRVCSKCAKEVHRRVDYADGMTYETAVPIQKFST